MYIEIVPVISVTDGHSVGFRLVFDGKPVDASFKELDKAIIAYDAIITGMCIGELTNKKYATYNDASSAILFEMADRVAEKKLQNYIIMTRRTYPNPSIFDVYESGRKKATISYSSELGVYMT